MEHLKYTCDKCGTEMLPTDSYLNHVKLVLRYCQCVSMGEEGDEFDFDLCGECAKKLSFNIQRFMNEKYLLNEN